MIQVYSLACPDSAAFRQARGMLRRELEVTCGTLAAAGDDLVRTRAVLQVIDIRSQSLTNRCARRLLRILVSDARRRGV